MKNQHQVKRSIFGTQTSLVLLTLSFVSLPVSATGEEEMASEPALFDQIVETCEEKTDPPLFGIESDVSHLSYTSNTFLYYEVCNLSKDSSLDLAWRGPNVATAYGRPLPEGLCLRVDRSARAATQFDTKLVLRGRSNVTAMAYLSCDYVDPSPFDYLLNRIYSVYEDDDYDYPRPFRIEYSIRRDEDGRRWIALYWWPGDYSVLLDLSPDFISLIDWSSLKTQGVTADEAQVDETDVERWSELIGGSRSLTFFAFQRDEAEKEEGDDGRDYGYARVELSTDQGLRIVQMPMMIKDDDGDTLVYALFDGVVVPDQ